jgi:hypothetical protein
MLSSIYKGKVSALDNVLVHSLELREDRGLLTVAVQLSWWLLSYLDVLSNLIVVFILEAAAVAEYFHLSLLLLDILTVVSTQG